MSDKIPSPRDPMYEDVTDAELEETEALELEEADEFLDAQTAEEIGEDEDA